MKDIRVAKLKNSLVVKNVVKVSSNPAILQITGEKFESATEVLINNISAQQWVATENDIILVYLPASLSTVPITSVAVITEDFVKNIPNLVYFEIGNKIQAVEGIQKLIQNFVKILLQSPGSNKFQSVGGGLLKIAGQSLINGDKTARTDIIDAITRTKSYLFSAHSKNPKIPLSEKLLDVQILSITVGENGKTDLIVSLAIKNRLGEQSSTNVAI